MIARTVFGLAFAACVAMVPTLAPAQDVAKPEEPAIYSGAGPTENNAQTPVMEQEQRTAPVAAEKAETTPAENTHSQAAVVSNEKLDAVPSDGAPDPLTPPEQKGPAPQGTGRSGCKARGNCPGAFARA